MTVIEINTPEHTIKSVTVFKSQRAEIVRVFPLELKAGRNKVEVKSLPGAIDTKSIRVSGLGHTRLLDVVCLLNNSQLPSPTDASEIISALNRKLQALRKEKDVLTDEARILASYSKTLTGEHISPENMGSFLKAYVEQNKKNLFASAALEDAIRDVERQVKEEEIKRNMKKGPPSNGEVTMAIEAAVDTNIDLKLTYIVNGATWEPMYELHATTHNGKPSSTVTLNYRARITQSTGEDWADASLTLSTSNTSMNTTIPGLPSIKLRPKALHASMQQPQQQAYPTAQQSQQQMRYRMQMLQQAQQQQQQLTQSMPMMQQQQQQPQPPVPMGVSFHTLADSAPFTSVVDNEGSFNEDDFEDITPVDGKTSTSVVKDSALAVTYAVQGKSTVPSDGIAHMVSIAELDFDAEIKYVAVPRVEAVVYLQCEVKNTSEYRLLPGFVSVIFDESFVSQTTIADISAGDTFTCTLGIDPATKITYLRKATHSDTKAGTFTEAKRTTSYTVKIRITNKHAFALADIVVREALPMVDVVDQESGITGSNKARVILRKPLGLADAKVGEDLALDGQKVSANAEGDFRVRWQKAEGGQLGGDKDGKFEWFGGLKTGEKVELEAGWDIKTPEDVKWVEVNRS